MHKSIRKSLYLCAAALMIGGVVAPSVSNNISASAHSRYTVSRYRHKKNVHKYDTKRITHLRRVHSYNLRMEAKDKRNLANHKKTLAHYNHLLRVHKHNREMINNLIRSKRKLIRMIKNDQRGIARYAKYVESEEHQINVARGKVKRARNHKHNNTMSLAKYNSLLSKGYYDGSHSKRANARGSKQERAVYNNGYIKGLAKFSHNLKKLRNEATINHTQYLSSIAYAAGFDDGYHNDTNNQMNPTLIKLFHSWTGHIKDIYVQGLKAGQKARVNMENHKNKTVIPKVIIPSNFNKIIKPIVNNKSKNVKPNVIPNPNADQNSFYNSEKKNNFWYDKGYQKGYSSDKSYPIPPYGTNNINYAKGTQAGKKARDIKDHSHNHSTNVNKNLYNKGYKYGYDHKGIYIDTHLSSITKEYHNNRSFFNGLLAGEKAQINWDSKHHYKNHRNYNIRYRKELLTPGAPGFTYWWTLGYYNNYNNKRLPSMTPQEKEIFNEGLQRAKTPVKGNSDAAYEFHELTPGLLGGTYHHSPVNNKVVRAYYINAHK